MARIRKWQETLMVACAALFFSVGRAWPLGARDAASHEYSTYSHLVVRTNRKTALGVELATRGLYIRLIRTSLVPVAMPLAAGAYVATAAGAGASATAAPASSCNSCNTRTATCCTVRPGDPCCDHHCTRSCTAVTTNNPFSGTRECIVCRFNFGSRTTYDCHTF
jgi:hypothetical protein